MHKLLRSSFSRFSSFSSMHSITFLVRFIALIKKTPFVYENPSHDDIQELMN